MSKIGILHPGAMGISVAASAKNSGHAVYWASAGRSEATKARVAKVGLMDAGTVADLCATCEVIISVCPPHAAEDVAEQVIAHGFAGLYVDANAISPARVKQLHAKLTQAGASCVDGGIIGGPAWKPNATWLYLAGTRAKDVAACFASGPLETQVLGEDEDAVGQASALKMCYAAYSKGSTALVAAALAAAEALAVRAALQGQWARDDASMPDQVTRRIQGSTPKAWRFVGEMDEIAETFRAAGLPGGFHEGAAEVYSRLAHLKDAEPVPGLDAILAALLAAAYPEPTGE